MTFDFPKIDLHLHLDGAMPPELSWELAHEQGVKLPVDNFEDFKQYVIIADDNRSVNEFLRRFDLPTELLQTKDALTRTAKAVVEKLAGQGLGYAELRFAPQIHTQKGLTQRDAVEAVLEGARQGMENCPSIKIGIILCCMVIGEEHINRDANLETVDLAAEFEGKGVVAMDLAGAEGLTPLHTFGYLFERGKQLGLNFTCHAGDSQGPDTVEDALNFGTKRLGHGHHIFDAPELVERGAKDGVGLEICLTSNIQCCTQPSFEEHPAKKLMDAGLLVTLNTDNPTISNTWLDKEYELAVTRCGFSYNDVIRANINSVRICFMPEEDKTEYIKVLESYMTEE